MSKFEMNMLGYKIHNYCDDSESDDNVESQKLDEGKISFANNKIDRKYLPAMNTGPKGVIEDKRQYQCMLFSEYKRNQQETLESLKKISLQCELAGQNEDSGDDKLEDVESDKYESSQFFKEYCRKRLNEMHLKFSNMPIFGIVTKLSVENFTSSIDREQLDVVVVVLVYTSDTNFDALASIIACFDILAKRYIKIKFCTFDVINGTVSKRFKRKGCPAIIAYQNGAVIGSIVSLSRILGSDIYVSDLEGLLLKNNIIHTTCLNHE